MLQREINFREKEISKLNADILAKEGYASSAAVSGQINGQMRSKLESQLQQRDMQIKKL